MVRGTVHPEAELIHEYDDASVWNIPILDSLAATLNEYGRIEWEDENGNQWAAEEA